jgi:hypothetical protein
MTPAQATALRYIATLRTGDASDLDFPRWDILRRLRAAGLVDFHITYEGRGTTGRAAPKPQISGLTLTAAGWEAL